MSNPTQTARPNVVIKGSWEDLLAQAHRAAANQNDNAVALYEKVRDGLRRLPEAQRAANGGRLDQVLEEAAANLHVFLTQQERYDEALAALDQVEEITAGKDEGRAWQQRRAMVLVQAGRYDEAVQELRNLANGPQGRLTDWGNLVIHYARVKDFDQATATIGEAEAWRQQQPASTESTPSEDEAYLANLRCIVALSMGQYEEAIRWYEQAAQLDPYYAERPYLLYARLLFHNQAELALPWVKQDKKHPIRAGFWHGVALKRLGKENEARSKWEAVLKGVSQQTNNEEFVELVLCFYYLGDNEGTGLNGVLRTLQSGGAQSWLLLFLAGLGWMLRGNLPSARTNFALAVTRRKAGAEGAKLSAEVWQYCQDLLSSDDQEKIVGYFQTEA